MKVIRIKSCEECPWRDTCINGHYCAALDETGTSRECLISEPMAIKLNCPLEDEHA